MQVAQAELDLILRSKFARRMMRLPVTYDSEAIQRHCPMRKGSTYRLTDGKRELAITVSDIDRQHLEDLNPTDARREGFSTVQQALDAFAEQHGPKHAVWVISFALSDSLTDEPIFLAKDGGYTTSPSRQAVPGDPEVMLVPGSAERARVMALARRSLPERQRLRHQAAELETLREAMADMKVRNLLRRAARTVEAAERALCRQQVLHSGLSTADDGSAGEAGPPSRGAPVASLEAA